MRIQIKQNKQIKLKWPFQASDQEPIEFSEATRENEIHARS